jgi:hypothetical protein
LVLCKGYVWHCVTCLICQNEILFLYTYLYWLTNQPTNQQTSWNRLLLEKLIVPLLVREFPIFHSISRLITLLIRAHYLSLSRARWIESVPSNFSKIHFN